METHTAPTNDKGVFSLVIGQGTVVSGQFDTLRWGAAAKWVQIEMDAAGGTAYVLMNAQQLASVPYALYAENTSLWQKGGANAVYYHAGNVGIGTINPIQKLHINGKLRVGAYTLPEVDGTNGQVLTTDGAGNVIWKTAAGGGSDANTLIYTVRGF